MGINEGRKKKDFISVNKGMTKKTFEKRGLTYVSEVSLQNLSSLKKILEYNISKDIYVYRMSSDMFPCIGFYKLIDLPNFDIISKEMYDIGSFIKKNRIRVSFHPSHFCVLASQNPDVVSKTIDELDKHAEIMDIMRLDQSHYYPINIHIGTTRPNCKDSMDRFCYNFSMLSESCKKRLTVENDDSPTQYSVKMLYDGVYSKIKIPIVFDQFHFLHGPQDQNMEQALKLAISTWNVKPLTHMSSSKKIEDDKSVKTAHADFIYEKIQTFGLDFDVELECKKKDLALMKYRKDFI